MPEALGVPGSPAEVLDSLDRLLPRDPEMIPVVHSNAGLYAPGLLDRRGYGTVVFVDAVLPPPRGSRPVAPAALLDTLRPLIGPDGVLPPWTHWWSADEVRALVPDQEMLRRVAAEQSPVPWTYLASTVQVPDGWDDVRGAYVAFGDTYAADAAEARTRGWPVRRMAGRHLHMLVDPTAVASAVTDVVDDR